VVSFIISRNNVFILMCVCRILKKGYLLTYLLNRSAMRTSNRRQGWTKG